MGTLNNSLDIRIGTTVIYKGQIFTIKKVVDLENVMLFNKGGDIAAKIKDLSIVTEQEQKVLELVSISEKDWQEAQRKYQIIKPIVENDTQSNGELVKQQAKKYKVDIATIYRWLKNYQETGTLQSLVPKERTGGRAQPRTNEEVEVIVQSVIDELYLSKQKNSITKIYREIFNRCKNTNIKAPHITTIRRRIQAISEEDRLRFRLGDKYQSKRKFEVLKSSFPDANYPLSVVQIDHTKLDIILVDNHTRRAIGRPYLTVAIDVYSRMIVGYYLSFDPPSSLAVGMCLANSILPKEKLISKFNIDTQWNCWGVMRTIHVDNAKEFRGDMLQRACQKYNIEINWRPVKKPHWGGHIERLIGTIVKEIHNLSGTTFSNIQDRKNYDSEKKAIFTLDEFEKYLLLFITNIYHKRLHKGIGMSPLQKYTEGVFGGESCSTPTGLPVRILDEQMVYLDFMPFYERSIQEYGVVIEHIHYYHDVLRKYIHAFEDDKKSKKGYYLKKFIFKQDPRDISCIYFYDPELKQYFNIPYRDTSQPPMTIWEYKEAMRRLETKRIKYIDEQAIFDAYKEINEMEEEAKKKSQKAKFIHRKQIKSAISKEKSKIIDKIGTTTNIVREVENNFNAIDFNNLNIEAFEEIIINIQKSNIQNED